MVKERRIMLRTFLWPGWGHLALGERKKGWFLWWSAMVGLGIICWGLTIYLIPEGVSPQGEEVQITETGIIAEEMFEEVGEVSEESPFGAILLPLTVTLVGLILLSWAGIYAYKDTRKLLK
ncbi:MAG TPA: hypothetical protein EYP78_06060 [Candidatus Omnitrophica bacterium]|nr:hypothetical protein [Candidatus Omnitrophota bacterium]